MSGTPTLPRLRGETRRQAAEQMANEYRAGASLRALAAQHGRSYGLMWTLVQEGGATLRGRGGARSGPRS